MNGLLMNLGELLQFTLTDQKMVVGRFDPPSANQRNLHSALLLLDRQL
jgi:hypothetical protein